MASHHQPSNSGGIAEKPEIKHFCQICPKPILLLSSQCPECYLNSGFCPNCRRHQFCGFCSILKQINYPNINRDDLATDEDILSNDPSEEVPVVSTSSPEIPVITISDSSSEASEASNSSEVQYVASLLDSSICWEIVHGGSRKRRDLLRDGLGNEYTKRSAGVWQCTKMKRENPNKNLRCQAIVREKNGRFIIDKDKNHSH